MADEALESEEEIADLSRGHRELALPLLKSIEGLGGKASPKPATQGALESMRGLLTEGQIAYLQAKNRM
jgi:hypothetical protein